MPEKIRVPKRQLFDGIKLLSPLVVRHLVRVRVRLKLKFRVMVMPSVRVVVRARFGVRVSPRLRLPGFT